MPPMVSVLMPVYNAEKYLAESMESIIKQTFTDFEFLIFNDASTDASWDIIQSFSDPRIKAFNSTENKGYVSYLNKGIEMASGKYLARMDADDISLPNRFAKQVSLLEADTSLVMCGTWYQNFGKRDEIGQLPFCYGDICLHLLHNNVFCHPSVMIRRQTLIDNELLYLSDMMPAEDYTMWTSLMKQGYLANIPEVLLKYRVHESNYSLNNWTTVQQNKYSTVQTKYIQSFFPKSNLSDEDFSFVQSFFMKRMEQTPENIEKIEQLLTKLIDEFEPTGHVSKLQLESFLKNLFYYLCTTSTHLGPVIVRKYFTSNLKNHSFIPNLKLIVKSIFRYKAIWV